VPIVAIPYPTPIDLTARGCQIALSTGERASLDGFLAKLDQAVQWAADRERLYFAASMVDALHGHQLCDRQAGLNFLKPYSISGAAGARFNPANWIHDSLHPNEVGHRLMFCAFANWLAGQPASTFSACTPPDVGPQRQGHNCRSPLTAPASPGQPCRLNAVAPAQPNPPVLGPLPPGNVTLDALKQQAHAYALSELANDVWPFALIPLGMIVGFALLWGAALGALGEEVQQRRTSRHHIS
jgi:hypothetical protein